MPGSDRGNRIIVVDQYTDLLVYNRTTGVLEMCFKYPFGVMKTFSDTHPMASDIEFLEFLATLIDEQREGLESTDPESYPVEYAHIHSLQAFKAGAPSASSLDH